MKWWHKAKGHTVTRRFTNGYPWGYAITCSCGKGWNK